MAEPNAWDGRHAELTGGEDATVTGNDAAVAVGQDWIRPAEFSNAGGDLGHLGVAVRTAVPGIWD
jgi:hypothetical protein